MVSVGCTVHTHVAVGASAAALTFAPSSDSEIQPYNGVTEGIILGHHSGITALATTAGGKTTFGVQVVQEPAYVFGQTVAVADAPYPIIDQLDGLVATGIGYGEPYFIPSGKKVPRDADLVAYANGPGSDAAVILSHILYGSPLYADQIPGKRFARLLEDASDCSGTSKEELEQSPLNNLDPKKLYALLGLAGVNEDAIGHYVSFECPSFKGMVPKGLFAGGYKITHIYHPINRRQLVWGVFMGSESATISFTGCGTQKPGAIVELIEIGNTDALSTQGDADILVGGQSDLGGSFTERLPSFFKNTMSNVFPGL